MILMELTENNLILQLKSRLFELVFVESDEIEYEKLIGDMLQSLAKLLKATEVSLFNYDEWRQALYLQFSTNEENIGKEIPRDESKHLDEKIKTIKNVQEIPIPYFKKYDILIPLINKNKTVSCILIKGKNEHQYDQLAAQFLNQMSEEITKFLTNVHKLSKIVHEEKRYRQLYRVTSKFHSSMDMNDVLGEIIQTLDEVYPTFSHYLLLSQDTTCDCNLPVKDLQYDNENITAMQAYLTGEVQIESCEDRNLSILYAPLKGKQGVYGILQVNAPETLSFPKNEINFIELLANTGGSALENAQLYQQSKRLIADLQLINETSHHLNANLRLNESITYICERVINSFGANEVGFILFTEDNGTQVLQGSTDFFTNEDPSLYIDYMSKKIKKEKDSFFIGDLTLQINKEIDIEYRSIMGVPMLESDTLKGFAIVMHREPYHFTFESFKLLQSLIHHSTLAISNSMLHEELEKMVITDHLTKLYSRNYLDDMLQMSMKTDAFGTFILIDIDDFKQVNDTYGHQVGDEVLIQVANVIKNNIRSSDIGARWGGEELAIYLPRISHKDGIEIGKRFLRKVAEETDPQVTISIGVSYWSKEKDDSVKELFQRADNALYKAKRTGKNRLISQLKDD